VRHEEDGFRFPVGDVAALAAGLRRVAEEPGVLPTWAGAAPAPVPMEEHAAWLTRAYQELIAGRERA